MLRLVDSLLDYARAEDYIAAADDIDLGGLVDDIWEQITDAFPDRRAVLRRPAPFSCRFSRLALERILANLLRNAVAYVPDDRVPEIELDLKRLDNRLRISVADNGTGIPPDQQEKIFELFHRVQPAVSDGSGVGLAVVKRVVDAAGGTITVAPRPEGGAIFTVDLPLCLPESSAK
jgi:signal transduction histidine kinase